MHAKNIVIMYQSKEDWNHIALVLYVLYKRKVHLFFFTIITELLLKSFHIFCFDLASLWRYSKPFPDV